eukprot:TRINITY_DN848_c0_g1_i2.p1 TRINITY_DN848_c0_g1~~TRINITY_DN848_c0_g1_i2.p1  ORF type:complete len:984 (-),score=223.96 TRINITY_DN848_c0_g1_i2:160-3111(-)
MQVKNRDPPSNKQLQSSQLSKSQSQITINQSQQDTLQRLNDLNQTQNIKAQQLLYPSNSIIQGYTPTQERIPKFGTSFPSLTPPHTKPFNTKQGNNPYFQGGEEHKQTQILLQSTPSPTSSIRRQGVELFNRALDSVALMTVEFEKVIDSLETMQQELLDWKQKCNSLKLQTSQINQQMVLQGSGSQNINEAFLKRQEINEGQIDHLQQITSQIQEDLKKQCSKLSEIELRSKEQIEIDKQYNELKKSFKNTELILDKSKFEEKRLIGQVEDLRQQRDNYKQLCGEQKAKLEKRENEYGNILKQLQDKDKQVEELQKTIEKLQSIEQFTNTLKQQKNDLFQQVESQRKVIQTQKMEQQSINKLVSDISEQHLKSDNLQNSQPREKLEALAQVLNSKSQDMQQIRNLENKYNEKLNQMQSQIEAQQIEIRNKQFENQRLEGEIQIKEKESEELLIKQKNQIEKELQTLHDQDLLQKVAPLKQQIEELEKIVQQLQTQKQDNEQAIYMLQQNNQQLNEDSQQLLSNQQLLEERCQGMLQEKNTQISDLQSQVYESQNLIQQLKEQFQDKDKQYQQILEEKQIIERKIEVLEQDLGQKREYNFSLTQQLSLSKQENENNSKVIQMLEKKLTEYEELHQMLNAEKEELTEELKKAIQLSEVGKIYEVQYSQLLEEIVKLQEEFDLFKMNVVKDMSDKLNQSSSSFTNRFSDIQKQITQNQEIIRDQQSNQRLAYQEQNLKIQQMQDKIAQKSLELNRQFELERSQRKQYFQQQFQSLTQDQYLQGTKQIVINPSDTNEQVQIINSSIQNKQSESINNINPNNDPNNNVNSATNEANTNNNMSKSEKLPKVDLEFNINNRRSFNSESSFKNNEQDNNISKDPNSQNANNNIDNNNINNANNSNANYESMNYQNQFDTQKSQPFNQFKSNDVKQTNSGQNQQNIELNSVELDSKVTQLLALKNKYESALGRVKQNMQKLEESIEEDTQK